MNKLKFIFKIFFLNFTLLFFFIFILELIFGNWFKDISWGNTLRSERSKEYQYQVKFDKENYNFKYKKNSIGFRGNEEDPKNLEVILIGGSTTNERFTPLELTISGQLNKKLIDDGLDIKIFNGGVDGQSTVGHIVNFKKWFPNISNFKPKVIMYYIGINERFYFNFNPNPLNFYTDKFNTPHDFENMERNDFIGRWSDYIKNNSFIASKARIIKFKYFKKKVRSSDYSNFSLTYNLNDTIKGKFISQDQADSYFNLNELITKDKNDFSSSLTKRLKHLNDLTKEIGATPIFINQVMYNGQGNEVMYYTNYIMREFFKKNKDIIFIDLAKNITLDIRDFYDEFHTKPSGSKKIADTIYPLLKSSLSKILLP